MCLLQLVDCNVHAINASAMDAKPKSLRAVAMAVQVALSPRARKIRRKSLFEATAWRLVSEGPARMLGLLDRGRLEPGLRADLVVMDRATRRIVMTIAAGQVAWLSGEVAARLF